MSCRSLYVRFARFFRTDAASLVPKISVQCSVFSIQCPAQAPHTISERQNEGTTEH